jgi:hypothetical protein
VPRLAHLTLRRAPRLRPSACRSFGYVRDCDGCRTKGITPEEVREYADGDLQEQYPDLQWVSSREGRKKKMAEVQFGKSKPSAIPPHPRSSSRASQPDHGV